MPKEVMIVAVVMMVCVFSFATIAMREFFKSRRQAESPSNRTIDDLAQQLAVLQQSIDTTAIEVERIGEGLRFTTKLLSEQKRVPELIKQPERVITPH